MWFDLKIKKNYKKETQLSNTRDTSIRLKMSFFQTYTEIKIKPHPRGKVSTVQTNPSWILTVL